MKTTTAGKGQEEVVTLQEIRKRIEELYALQKRCERFTCELSAKERKRLPRGRANADRFIDAVADVASRKGLVLAGVSVAQMRADSLVAERVRPLLAEVAALTQLLADTVLAAQSRAWRAATAYYSVLKRFAVMEPQLQTMLRPAREFFVRKPKKILPPASDAASPVTVNGGEVST